MTRDPDLLKQLTSTTLAVAALGKFAQARAVTADDTMNKLNLACADFVLELHQLFPDYVPLLIERG